jgi:Tol biopolymer transport system component
MARGCWLLVVLAAAVGAQDFDQLVFSRDGDLWAVPLAGGEARRITHTPERESRPVACPDGMVIAYEVYDDLVRDYAVWLCSADGQTARKVLPMGRTPAWSPDGGRLLFVLPASGGLDICLATRAGGNVLRLTETTEPEYFPVWAPDGARVAFVRDVFEGQRRSAIVVREPNGREQTVTTVAGGITSLSWAPAERLLYSARAGNSGRDELFVVAPDGGKPQLLSDGLDSESLAVWTGDGQQFVYIESSNNQTRLKTRGPGVRGKLVAGTQSGDGDPSVLPGLARRAPQVFVRGRRSFYLPTPRLVGEDLLVPVADLAGQLGLTVAVDVDGVTLAQGEKRAKLSLDGKVALGEVTKEVVPSPLTVAGVMLAPARAVAEWFGFASEWRGETRVLRLGEEGK